ncbi:hypothetical protein K1719_044276 [Acacia pycnantha]|nr:hypothetical protein K1719_044276 [Acacia pycnantha]
MQTWKPHLPCLQSCWKDVPLLATHKNHATGYCEGSSANMEASSALSVSSIMYALVLKVKAPSVTVTGTMDAKKLVDYVYRCTKKQANIVPQPEPEPEKKEEPKEAKKTAEEAKAEEKKEEKPAAEKPKKEEEGDKEVGEDKSENKEQKRGVI